MKLRCSSSLLLRLELLVVVALLSLAGCHSTPSSGSEVTEGGAGGLSARQAQLAARLQAWRDSEKLASLGPDRTSVAGAGESMAPVYHEGCLLVIVKVGYRELSRGMKVAYRTREGRQVVHQLVEQTPDGWRVRGLNNGDEDSERVTAKNLLGVVYASLDATFAGAFVPVPE